MPEVRQEAAITLGDLEAEGRCAVPVLLDRLRSSCITLHDRACAAWALGQIKHDDSEVVPVLLAILEQTPDQEATAHWSDRNEAGELRRYCAEAIERITDDHDLVLSVARACLQDSYWKCRMVGLGLIEQIGGRGRELLPLVRPLLNDELSEIRASAERIVNGWSAPRDISNNETIISEKSGAGSPIALGDRTGRRFSFANRTTIKRSLEPWSPPQPPEKPGFPKLKTSGQPPHTLTAQVMPTCRSVGNQPPHNCPHQRSMERPQEKLSLGVFFLVFGSVDIVLRLPKRQPILEPKGN